MGRTRLGQAALMATLAAGLAASAPGQNPPDDVNLWPILILDRHEDGTEVQVLPPLGEWTTRGDHQVRALRPLVMWERQGPAWKLDLLWPLAGWRESPGGRAGHIFPIYGKREADGDGHLFVVPVYWSWTSRGGRQRGWIVPPFWLVRGDDLTFGLCPILAYDRGPDRLIWVMPFIWSRDPTRPSGGMGLLPVWLSSREPDRQWDWVLPVFWERGEGELRTFAVVPVFWKGRDSTVLFPFIWSLNRGDTLAVFPIYGRLRRGEDSVATLVLFPLYYGDRKGDYVRRWLLWPIFSWGGGGEESRQWGVFPLLTRKRIVEIDRLRRTERFSASALWPIFTWGRSTVRAVGPIEPGMAPVESTRDRLTVFPLIWARRNETRSFPPAPETPAPEATDPQRIEQDRGLTIFPLYWSSSDRQLTRRPPPEVGYSTADVTSRNWLLPLYTWDRTATGARLTVLWPFWSRRRGEDERQIEVLWRLFDMRSSETGDRRIRVLWRGYRDERAGEAREIDVFPFITYRSRGPDSARFQFLGGLVEWGADAGRRYLRLLYLPRWRLGPAAS